jgi:hypothetical protein
MIPTLLLPLDESLGGRDRAGAVVASVGGPVRWRDGGLFIEQGTLNLVTNPVAFVNRTGIGVGNLNVTHESLTGQTIPHPSGIVLTTAVRATFTANGGTNVLSFNASLTSTAKTVGMPVYGQMLIRGGPSTIGKSVTCFLYETGGASASEGSGATSFVVTGDWQLISTPGTLRKVDRTSMAVYLQCATGQTGNTFDITAGQLEANAVMSTFAWGSIGTGYGWFGAPNNSASFRIVSSIGAPYTDPFGSAIFRYRESGAWHDGYTTAPGAIGAYGSLAIADDVLTITTTRDMTIGPFMAADRPLNAAERDALFSADEWSWDMLIPQFGGIVRSDHEPAFSILRGGEREFSIVRGDAAGASAMRGGEPAYSIIRGE